VDAISKSGSVIVSIIDDIPPKIKADIYVSTLPKKCLPQFIDGSKFLFGPEYVLIRKEITLNNYRNTSIFNKENQKIIRSF
jgi:hypothetical protein